MGENSTERAPTRNNIACRIGYFQWNGVTAANSEHVVSVKDNFLHIDVVRSRVARHVQKMAKGRFAPKPTYICPICGVRYDKAEHSPTCERFILQERHRKFLTCFTLDNVPRGKTISITGIDNVPFTVTRY